MIFHDHRMADTGKQTLLHTTLEAEDRDFRRWLVETVDLGTYLL